jgi:3-oxoadipate enol-lactonase
MPCGVPSGALGVSLARPLQNPRLMASKDAASLPPFALTGRPGDLSKAQVGAIEIAYWRGGLRGTPPVLFLHGLGWDNALWWPFVSRYLDRFDVICPDTRGHGASAKPPGPYSIELFASDMLGLLDGLALTGPTAVVGLSQGGMTAQMMAVRAPGRIAALAAVATSARVDPASAANMEERIRAQRDAGAAAAARIAATSIFSDGFLDRTAGYLEAFIAWRADMPAEPLESAMRALNGYDVLAALPALRIPILVVAGANDRLIPAAASRAIAGAVPGAQYVEIPESGHMIALEQPDALAAALDPFLQRYRTST